MRNLIPFIFIGSLILADVYTWVAVSTAVSDQPIAIKRIAKTLLVCSILLFYGIILGMFFTEFYREIDNRILKGVMVTAFIGLFLFKMFTGTILLLEDIFRVLSGSVQTVSGWFSTFQNDTFLPSRKKFISTIALAAGSLPLISVFYGMLRNAYQFKLYKKDIAINNLPTALKGLKIIQISDLHTGSMMYPERLQKAVDMINNQNPDLIFFTGDLVNSTTKEAYPFRDILKQLKSNYGNYSILGNHDYGNYHNWENEAEKRQNRADMEKFHKDIGWNLLLNEHDTITVNGTDLNIIGVENYSANIRFGQYGDLKKATQNCKDCELNILLSHDPSHWRDEVLKSYKNIQLTLSGHTHGFQFGVEIPWIKWSPAQWVYKEWAGLYKENDQYIYVNRGIGHLGYPGRVGILPEISVLTLV